MGTIEKGRCRIHSLCLGFFREEIKDLTETATPSKSELSVVHLSAPFPA
jgi:hypothetical protein